MASDRPIPEPSITNYPRYEDYWRAWYLWDRRRILDEAKSAWVVAFWAIAIILGATFLVTGRACGYSYGPQFVEADGQSFVSCGLVHVTADGNYGGDQVYTVSLTEKTIGDVTVRGIHKISVVDAPKERCAPEPSK